MARRQVISRGYSSWSPRVVVDAEDEIDVAYDVRQLGRNSKGAAVRVGTEEGLVDDFAEWVILGPSSGQSRMKAVDALWTTYNDARVLVAGDDTDTAITGVAADGILCIPARSTTTSAPLMLPPRR